MHDQLTAIMFASAPCTSRSCTRAAMCAPSAPTSGVKPEATTAPSFSARACRIAHNAGRKGNHDGSSCGWGRTKKSQLEQPGSSRQHKLSSHTMCSLRTGTHLSVYIGATLQQGLSLGHTATLSSPVQCGKASRDLCRGPGFISLQENPASRHSRSFRISQCLAAAPTHTGTSPWLHAHPRHGPATPPQCQAGRPLDMQPATASGQRLAHGIVRSHASATHSRFDRKMAPPTMYTT